MVEIIDKLREEISPHKRGVPGVPALIVHLLYIFPRTSGVHLWLQKNEKVRKNIQSERGVPKTWIFA